MTGLPGDRFHVEADRAATGGPERYHDQLKERGKLVLRNGVGLLCDPGSFIEDGLLANSETPDRGTDALITGRRTIDGRPVTVIANDATAEIAIMEPEAAIDVVHFNKIESLPAERHEAFVESRRDECIDDVDLLRPASKVVVHAVIQPEEPQLIMHLRYASRNDRNLSSCRHGTPPV